MKKIFLVSHGLMAMGTYEASKMIIGDAANVQYICLSADKDIEDFKHELEEKEWLTDCDELYVLADILGGSPYTTTLNFLQENGMFEKSRVITGMNLPLLISVAFGQNLLDKNQLTEVIEESRSGIRLFELVEEDDEDEL